MRIVYDRPETESKHVDSEVTAVYLNIAPAQTIF